MIRDSRVLIVEDEPIVGLALEDMLSDLGAAEILYAERLEEAETYLSGERPDCAILDVNVHGRPSYAIARRLFDLGIPFIFATGYGDSSHPEEFASIVTLTKPYGARDVQLSLDEAIRRTAGQA